MAFSLTTLPEALTTSIFILGAVVLVEGMISHAVDFYCRWGALPLDPLKSSGLLQARSWRLCLQITGKV
jgi:hypothetical protein